MKKIFFIFFFLISAYVYSQNVDNLKIGQIPMLEDSLLNMQIEDYALSEQMIEKGKFYDKADIYSISTIPIQNDTISVYLFTMPSNASATDWKIALRSKDNLSFYSYDICIYRLVYDLSIIAARESPIVSSAIICAIYDILSYCSAFYNETKYEIAGNATYVYSVSLWVNIFKKNLFYSFMQSNTKGKKRYIPTRKLNLHIIKEECLLSKINIDNWLRQTWGTSEISYKLYSVIDLSSDKSICLLETKNLQSKKFDFIFQDNNTFSFYLIDDLFVPLSFKLKEFVGDGKQDDLLKALKCLCLLYMYQYGDCSPHIL